MRHRRRLPGKRGYFHWPTKIRQCRAGTSLAFSDEIFGPVLTVETFAAEEEALGAFRPPDLRPCRRAVHPRPIGRPSLCRAGSKPGTVWVNRYGRSRDLRLPTGGYKRSGLGKDLGREAYLANRNSKSVLIGL